MTLALLFVVGALWWVNAIVYCMNGMTRKELGLPARGQFVIATIAALGGAAFMIAAAVVASR